MIGKVPCVIAFIMASPEQIKAARALLRMEQEELARRAGVSVTTIRRLEAVDREYTVAEETAEGVQNALQEAGVDGSSSMTACAVVHEEDRSLILVADLMSIAEERRKASEKERRHAVDGRSTFYDEKRFACVIAIDSSALVAILRNEPDALLFAEAIGASGFD